MSVGNPKVVVRMSPKLQHLVQSEVDARNFGKVGKAYTISDFVRSAVSEKLKHLARGRMFREKKKTDMNSEMAAVDQFLADNS